ncbi:MAG: hypothetical protein IJD17_04865 [Clostridia bacterium]|nr:hypothetical protein [Clostridia bacterium]
MDSQKKKLSLKNYSLCSVILASTALLFAIMLSVMMLTVYEPDMHYFKYASPWFSIFVAAVIAVGVIAVILAFTQKKGSLPTSYPTSGRYNRAASILSGFWLIGYAVKELVDILTKGVYSAQGQPVSGISRLFTGRFNSVSSVAAIIGIIGAFYLLLPFVSATMTNNTRIIFGCVLTVFFIFRLLVLYYDTITPINSPIKMLEQMAVVGAMLFTVYEMRFLLGEPKPRSYVVISTLSFILLASHSTSQIIASCFLSGMPYSATYMPSLFFELLFAIYIFSGLISYLTACKFYTPEQEVSELPEIEEIEE